MAYFHYLLRHLPPPPSKYKRRCRPVSVARRDHRWEWSYTAQRRSRSVRQPVHSLVANEKIVSVSPCIVCWTSSVMFSGHWSRPSAIFPWGLDVEESVEPPGSYISRIHLTCLRRCIILTPWARHPRLIHTLLKVQTIHDPKTFVCRLPCNPCKELFGNQVSWIPFDVPRKGAHRCLGHQVKLDHMPKPHSRIWQPRMLEL